MRFTKLSMVVCLAVVSLSVFAGCSKKAPEPTSPSTSGGGAATASAPAPSTPAAAPAQVEIDKPVSEIKAAAEAMSVDSLKATALKYKEAILAKQADLEKLTAKIKEIPLTEALGEQAKTLKTDLANLETSLKALKDRFQVYYDAIKTKGGDVANLAL
ncbi:MAG: hypothetical protein KBE65_19440 [Phycisphaerae bacterium]|nr:hypothetical protein [Phycisphaerae bacterium]